MALDQSFAESLINERHWICARRLRPFSAWHVTLLQTLDSPYLYPGRKIEAHDALTLLGICSLPYGRTRTRRPHNPISWWQTRQQERFERVNEKILRYIGDYLQKPEFAIHVPESSEAPSRRGQPPEMLQAVWDVIYATKWPEQLVWQLPMGILYWYQMMALKEKYDVDVIDEAEKKLQAQLLEKLAKQKAANGS